MTKHKSFGRELNTQGGPGRVCIACRYSCWPVLLLSIKRAGAGRSSATHGGAAGGEEGRAQSHHTTTTVSLSLSFLSPSRPAQGLSSCSLLRSSLSTNQINYSLFSVHRFSSCRLSGHRRRSNNASADDDADAAANNNAAVPAK